MCSVKALDKDTIVVDCGDYKIQICTGSIVWFTESYHTYSSGDEITVEPIKDQGEIQLLVRENHNHFTEAGIIEIVCENIVEIDA